MSNSLDFIKQRIESGCVADWVPRIGWDEDENQCMNPFDFLLHDSNFGEDFAASVNKRSYCITLSNHDGCSKITITYNPEYDKFQYVSFNHNYHDGTLLFVVDCIKELIYKPFSLQTCNIYNAPNDITSNWYNYDYKYVIGDVVYINEFGDFGTDEKPWIHTHTVAAMPIAFYYKKH